MARYIDADQLWDHRPQLTKTNDPRYMAGFNECMGGFSERIRELIDSRPDDDVVPKREGKFILFKPRHENRNATYRCSVCGKLCSSYYNDVGEWRYCPHCGRPMMKGGE